MMKSFFFLLILVLTVSGDKSKTELCCRRSGIPQICLRFCSSQIDSIFKKFPVNFCNSYLKKIISCVTGNKKIYGICCNDERNRAFCPDLCSNMDAEGADKKFVKCVERDKNFVSGCLKKTGKKNYSSLSNCKKNNCNLVCPYGFTRGKDGCENCECMEPCQRLKCNPPKTCQVLKTISSFEEICSKTCYQYFCLTKCSSGFERDSKGCPTCQCRRPCLGVKCGLDKVCKEVFDKNSLLQASCIPKKKVSISESCPQMMCPMNCPYGLKRDEKGCKFCECHNPCKGLDCNYPEACQIIKTFSGFKGICSKECSPVMCEMYCSVGFQRDSNGCEICKCRKPCEEIKCDPGFNCVAVEILDLQLKEICKQEKTETTLLPKLMCLKTNCNLKCLYGLDRDEKGCEVCKCRYPCQELNCPYPEVCQIVTSPSGSRAVCSDVCPPFMCLMFCSAGFQRDAKGCQMCKCREPCKEEKCEKGKVCIEITVNSQLEASCVENKISSCPSLSFNLFCPYGLSTDEFGCKVCKCFNPCQDINCKYPEACQVVKSSSGFEGICSKECSPVMCKRYCNGGFKRDSNGCEICKCRKPCEKAYCKKNEFCVEVVDENDLMQASCHSIIKDNKIKRSTDFVAELIQVPTTKECQEVTCDLICQNGLKKDLHGCPLCQCASPCDSLACTEEEKCVEYPGIMMKAAKCVPKNCPDVICTKFCSYNYITDSNGCFPCECVDPCKDVICKENEICRITQENYKYLGFCERTDYPEGSTEVCKTQSCAFKCFHIGNSDFYVESIDCSVCICENLCQNVDCGQNSFCQLNSSTIFYTDMAFFYEKAICSQITRQKRDVVILQSPKKECKPPKCPMICEFGLKVDDEGCQICSCFDPCKGVECPEHQSCSISLTSNSKYQTECKNNTECLDLNCDLNCSVGYAKTIKGCLLCACREICPIGTCLDGETCHFRDGKEVCLPNKKCKPLKCSMICEFGLKVDDEGCQICSCFDPCKGVECPEHQSCSISLTSNDKYQTECKNNKDCFTYHCNLSCKFGFAKNMKGCPVCACLDPCQNKKCNEGYHCIAIKSQNGTFCIPNDSCSNNCKLTCEFGSIKDNKGCETCECIDPCKNVLCKNNEKCYVERTGKSLKGVCKKDEVCKPLPCVSTCSQTFPIKGCSPCVCRDPCSDCTNEENCVIKNNKANCEVSSLNCVKKCVFGYKKENEIKTCECNQDPCESSNDCPKYRCLSTFHWKNSNHKPYICRAERPCDELKEKIDKFPYFISSSFYQPKLHCKSDGFFKPIQCQKDFNFCFCVNSVGELNKNAYKDTFNIIDQIFLNISCYPHAVLKGMMTAHYEYEKIFQKEELFIKSITSAVMKTIKTISDEFDENNFLVLQLKSGSVKAEYLLLGNESLTKNKLVELKNKLEENEMIIYFNKEKIKTDFGNPKPKSSKNIEITLPIVLCLVFLLILFILIFFIRYKLNRRILKFREEIKKSSKLPSYENAIYQEKKKNNFV